MEYRRLGKAGIKVSALSLGAWVTYGEQVGEDVAEKCMAAAWEHGVNFFDNAEGYGNGKAEVVMGNVIKKLGWTREDFVVSTKIFWGGSGPNDTGLSHKHVIEGVNKALKRLQVDYVDLVFCHRPDRNTPIEETVRAMDILFPGIGEIVGGSQREERLEKLEERMREMHIPVDEMSWFLDTRRFGSAPHAGFGLGFERLVLFVTGMTNIRDVIPFPRTPKNAEY